MPSTSSQDFIRGQADRSPQKDGGIRPIAVGYYWRRLVAKCANAYGIDLLANFFSPGQLGVGMAGGCEAAIHAARRFLCEAPSDYVLAKLDFSNAFNCLHRDTMLSAVADQLPKIYRFCHLAYSVATSLVFGEFEIESCEGAQQGDPLGPLLFCLALQPVLNDLTCPLKIAFMDDVTLGGPSSVVAEAVDMVAEQGASLGLLLNRSKCKVIGSPEACSLPAFDRFSVVDVESACLLGAPLLRGLAMDHMLESKCVVLERAMSRLCLLAAQDALTIHSPSGHREPCDP